MAKLIGEQDRTTYLHFHRLPDDLLGYLLSLELSLPVIDLGVWALTDEASSAWWVQSSPRIMMLDYGRLSVSLGAQAGA